MMGAETKRFQRGFGASIDFHGLVFGFAAAVFGGVLPQAAVPQEEIFSVEWVGGGGGSNAPAGQPLEVAAVASAPAYEQIDAQAITDLTRQPQIVSQTGQQPGMVSSAPPVSIGAAERNGTGSGTGNGVGAGSGDGSGNGTGGGTGNGNGPGTGDGSGDGITAHPAVPPRLVRRVQPDYPETARQTGKEGTTLLRFVVSAVGRVSDVQVVRSSGSDALDDAAGDAVERWRFSPAKDGQGRDVACYITVPVSFSLG